MRKVSVISNKMKNIIERPYYTDKLRPYIGQPIIKVLTGQRRIGKSHILLQLIEKIRHEDPSANIIAINKELKEFSNIRTMMSYINISTRDFQTSSLIMCLLTRYKKFQTFRIP